MTLKLSTDLDIDRLRAAFAERGRMRIPNVLTPDSAEALTEAMEAFDDWRISVSAGGEVFELPLKDRRAADPDRQSWIDDVRIDGSSPRMQYVFDTRRLTVEGMPDLTSDAVSQAPDFLNSAAFIAFVRGVTGDDRIDFADAQATRYRPGHVLTTHSDEAAGKNRLYAYVLNLTRDWRADWGGALLFFDARGDVVDGYVPAHNTLNLFRVPENHAVAQIASFSPRDRLSITGWLRSRQAI